MNSSRPYFSIAYRLLKRFEALIEMILVLPSTGRQLGMVRFKPIFANYNSCIEEFKSHYPSEFAQLGLEELPLVGAEGKELFTASRLSTLLHQSQAVVGFLKGQLPPRLFETPGGISIALSSQAGSLATSTASTQVQFAVVLEGLGQAVQESELDEQTKDELLKELEELRGLSEPTESKIKAFATRLVEKLLKVGQDLLIVVLTNWLRSQMPQ